MVETEFLFGFQPKDKYYSTVTEILKIFKAEKPFSLHYPVSALLEVREVMASHGKSSAERLNALTLIKVKAASYGIKEVGLFSNDLILCEDLLTQHRSLTFFDGLHAAVTLNNNFSVVSNDQAYDNVDVKRLSFKDLLDLLKSSQKAL